MKANKLEARIYSLFVILGLLVIFAGCVLVFVGAIEARELSNIDANAFLHEPTIYFNRLRDTVSGAMTDVVIGAGVVVVGAVALTVSLTRLAATRNEKKCIILLEKRIEKLEKELNQRKDE